VSTYGSGSGAGDPEWSPARAEAIAALSDTLVWTLSEASWGQVGDVIEEIAAAIAAASPAALSRTTGNLELRGPMRVLTRLGDPPVVPVPREIRERIVELINALTPVEELAEVNDRTRQDAS
jgi:hypothetical protein